MKKSMSLALMVLIMVFCFTVPTFAAEVEFDFSVDGDGTVIGILDDETGVLTISGSGAIKAGGSYGILGASYYKTVTEVIIGEGITSLGKYAFQGSSLKSISLPSTLTSIGEYAFYASSLESITIPASVKSIGDLAFYATNKLSSVIFEEGSKLESIGGSAFYGSGLTAIELPSSLTTIGLRAFCQCSSLKEFSYLGDLLEMTKESLSDMGRNASDKVATVSANNVFLKEALESLGYSVSTVGTQTADKFASYPSAFSFEVGANGNNVIAYVNPYTCALDLKGSGATADYNDGTYSLKSPLATDALKKITELNIDEGITYLGNSLFHYGYSSTTYSLEALKSVELPSTLMSIGNNTFETSAIQNIEIPANVTSIGSKAFYSSVSGAGTTVVFESGSKLETIGDAAFKDLDMTEIILPDGLKTIGANAFAYASNLATVYIPASVSTIGEYVFYGCRKVNDFTCLSTDLSLSENVFGGGYYLMGCDASNKTATVDGSQVYLADALEGLGYTVSFIGEVSDDKFASYPEQFVYELGDNVKGYLNQYSGEFIIIGTGDTYDYDYYNSPRSPIWDDMSYITSLIIEEGVTSLGDNVFYTRMSSSSYSNYCTLDECTSVSLPSTLTRIGANNFHGAAVASITIPANVTEIGEGAFKSADYIINFEPVSKLTTIGDSAFASTRFESIDLPDSVTTIGVNAFELSDITSINLPSNLKTIGKTAFRQAPLTSIEIPASVVSIGEGAFTHCSSLTSLTFEDGSQLETIGNGSFYDTKITSLIVPDGVTTIEGRAFKSCYYLEKVVIPESVETIGEQAFYEYGKKADSITLMNYADSVQTIGSEAFETDVENVTVYQYQANTTMTTALSESSASPVAVYYFDDIALSGDLDNGIHWEYDPDTKTLTFTGNGEIPNFTDGSQPWYGAASQYGGVGSYVFGSGITGVGSGVFGSYGSSSYGSNGSGSVIYGSSGLDYSGAGGGGATYGGASPSGGSTGDSSGGSSGNNTNPDGSDNSSSDKEQDTMIIVDAEPTNFLVTVPIVVNVSMDEDGVVDCGSGYYVENGCALGPVIIVDINVVAETSWSIVDWDSDFHNMKASSKNLALTINGVEVQAGGSVSLNDSLSSVIKNKETKELFFDAKLPAQRAALQENAAAIVFVVDFDKV